MSTVEELPQRFKLLLNCQTCPRGCEAARDTDRLGFCRTGLEYPVSSICIHRGEEPVLVGRHGVVNIFFAHCNMQCIYCQNYDISSNRHAQYRAWSLQETIHKVERLVSQGPRLVGFVSPSHVLPQVREIIETLSKRRELEGKHSLHFVYNTNGFDRVEMLAGLEGKIGIYLPDFKYMDSQLARRYSATAEYVEYATAALREMNRQVGSRLWFDDDGFLERGLIIRHLVLPGHVQNSIDCLRFIAEELSPSISISLMSQYHPVPRVARHPALGRTLHREEYEAVVEEFYRLGFCNGWVQDLGSPSHYLPDFSQTHPFEY